MEHLPPNVKVFVYQAFLNGCRLGLEWERGEGIDHSTNSKDLQLMKELWLDSYTKKMIDEMEEYFEATQEWTEMHLGDD